MLVLTVNAIIDTFDIIYLWVTLYKVQVNIFKLISISIIFSIPIIITNQFHLSFIIAYIINITIIKIVFRKNFKDVIFGVFLVILIEMLLQAILSLIVRNFVYNHNLEVFIVVLLTLISVGIFSKVTCLSNKFTLKHIYSNVLIYSIMSSSMYIIIFKLIWEYDYKIVVNNLCIFLVSASILIISQVFTYLYITKLIKEKETLKISNEYNNIINEIIQEIKQRQHDFINYKNTIMGIVAVVDDRDVKSAINNYMKDEEIHDNKINELIYIDNVVIRSIMYRSITKAKNNNINFKYTVENNVLDSLLSYNEISNLLNNLLNNAFDEVLKDECDEKNIEVNIFNLEKTSHLTMKNKIVNSNDINLNDMFTRGYSTKNLTGTRGYGLHNVKEIVNQHKGYIKLNIECEEIIFDIYFNNSSSISAF